MPNGLDTIMGKTLLKLGRRARELRKKAGLTQERLAELAGLHQTYVGGIERGERNVSVRTIAKLATALGVPLSTLFDFVDNAPPLFPEKSLKPLVVGSASGMEIFFLAFCRSSCKYFDSLARSGGRPDVHSFFSICCKNCEPFLTFRRYLNAPGRSGT